LCLDPSVLIELAELRHRLVNDAPTDTNAAHEAALYGSTDIVCSHSRA
jgi:hypothetical protein